MELGAQGSLLLQYVAMGEDRCDFLKPPLYFAAELMTACGVKDNESFKRTRERCEAKGWLVYKPGDIRQASAFWVTIPSRFSHLMEDKGSCGKTASSPHHHRIMTASSPDHGRNITASRPVDDRHLSPLSPSPDPSRVCGDGTHTHDQDQERDSREKNTEAVKRTMRGLGLSVRGEAVTEWIDFLRDSCECRKVDEYLYAMRWIVKSVRAAGGTVRFAPHVAGWGQECRNQVIARRNHKTNQEGKA